MEQSKVAETFLARQDRARNIFLRPFIDTLAAFALLCVLGLAIGIGPSSAGPQTPAPQSSYALYDTPAIHKAIVSAGDRRDVIEIATTSSTYDGDAVYGRTSFQAAWVLLMLSISCIAALNLAVYRHMRTAYSPKRRRNLPG